MKKFKYKFFVQYGDTDKMGYVYYANYYVWFEAARTDFLRKAGYSYKIMEQENVFLPVAESHCKHFSPAFFEDDIIVELWVSELKNASIKISYNVFRENDNTLLATGYTVHPAINDAGKIIRLPDKFKNLLSEYTG